MRWTYVLGLMFVLLASGCKAGDKRDRASDQPIGNRLEDLFKGNSNPKPAEDFRRPPSGSDPMSQGAPAAPTPVWPTETPQTPTPTISMPGPTLSLDVQTQPPAPSGDVAVRITVVNRSNAPSSSVSVVQPVPDTAQLILSQPMAQLKGSQLIWDLPPISGNGTQSVTAVYRPARNGALNVRAELYGPDGRITEAAAEPLFANNQLTAKPAVGQGVLNLRITGPSEAAPGETAAYDVRLANVGNAPAVRVLLTAEMDTGLDHESGSRRLEIPLPQLAVGEAKTVQLPLAVRGSGRLRTQFRLRADGCEPASEERFLEVRTGQLDFSMTGPPRPLFGQPGTWTLRVYNPGESAVSNVVVRVQLPAELQFQSASQGGQLVAGQVVWQMRQLAAKEPQTVQFTAVGRQLVERTTLIAAAHADRVEEKRSQIPLEILGTPLLRVRVKAAEDTAPVGAAVIYAVEVINAGSLPLADVDVMATVPPPLRPLFGSGPTMVTVEGNQVQCGRIARLEPGRTVMFRFEAEALQSGDARVRVEAKSPTLPGPVVQEDAVRVVPGR